MSTKSWMGKGNLILVVAYILLMVGCVENLNTWKVGNKKIKSSAFELHSGQSAFYAGSKFTLGTNNAGIQELDRLAYSLRMIEECGLTMDDIWFPKSAVERYSIKREIEDDNDATTLTQPNKVDISSFIFKGDGGVDIPITDKDGMIIRGRGVSQELLAKYQEIVNTYLEKTSTGNPDKIDKYYWKSDFLSEEDWTQKKVVTNVK